MNPLVSQAWLTNHLRAGRVGDHDLVLIDATLPPVGVTPVVDTYARFLDQHIPGAVFFDIEALSDHATNLPHMLPTAESFATSMSALGISDTDHIVVYEQQGVFSAPRAWWMLRTFGAKYVSVLDGGLEGWIDSGAPVQSGKVYRAAAHFHATLDTAAVKDLAAVKSILGEHGQVEHGQVVDARSAARFNGTAPEPRPGLLSGHMPGATSLPFAEVLHEGRLMCSDHLRATFNAKNIDIERPITTTCGSGVTAAVLALALEVVGAPNVSLYDGSWAEYASQPGAEILP